MKETRITCDENGLRMTIENGVSFGFGFFWGQVFGAAILTVILAVLTVVLGLMPFFVKWLSGG